MSSPPKKKPGEAGGAADRRAHSNQTSGRKFSAETTATEAQRARILNLLRQRPHNCYELRRVGCFQAPTRVFELRHQGFDIETTRVVVTDAEGFTHHGVALYTLVGKAEGGAA